MNHHQRTLRMAVWLAAWIMILLTVSQPVCAQSPWRGVKSAHFVVLAMTSEFDAGRITEEDLRKTADRFERIFSVFVNEWGLLPPAGPPSSADARVVVFVYDWTKAGHYKDNAIGRADTIAYQSSGTIHLKINHLHMESTDPNFVSPSEQVSTITHELFHAVQEAYDPNYRFLWMWEATAQWAEWLFTQSDETGGVLDWEAMFLNSSEYPLGYHEGKVTNPSQVNSVGHPYGSSVLFRFLGEYHGGPKLLKKYMDAWRDSLEWDSPPNGPTSGYHPLGLAAQALGMKGPDDPGFREIYDRFAVACALGPDAPGFPLAGAARFTSGARRVNSGWDLHYLEKARSPDDAVYLVPPSAVSELLYPGDTIFNLRARGVMTSGDTTIGTGGICCMSIARPNGLPENSMLRVEVMAEPDEVSVQGLIRRGLNQPVETVPGRYVADRRAYILEIAKFETASELDVKTKAGSADQYDIAYPFQSGLDEVLVVLTRYSHGPIIDNANNVDGRTSDGGPNPDRENAVPYPVFVSVATPPVVERFTLAQKQTTIFDARWVGYVNESGLLENRTRKIAVGHEGPPVVAATSGGNALPARVQSETRLDAALGDAEVEVWFSQPIPESEPPHLTLNGHSIALAPNAEEDRWRGTIPAGQFGKAEQGFHIRANAIPAGTELRLPLDEDLLTMATVTTHVDLLDPDAPRATEWTSYERTSEGMLLLLGMNPPKRELEYQGLVRDGSRLVKPNDVLPGDTRKVLESGATVWIETDTGTVGGSLTFAKERDPQNAASGKPKVDRFDAKRFSHVSYNWTPPETARGEIIIQGDARFEGRDEEGLNIWSENFHVALYRGKGLTIPGYPEFKDHFLVVFQNKPDRETLEQVLKAETDSLPAGVRAVLSPVTD